MSLKTITARGYRFDYVDSYIKEGNLYLKTINITKVEDTTNTDIDLLRYVSCIILMQNRFSPTFETLVENIVTPTEIKIWCEKREAGINLYSYSWQYARQTYHSEINSILEIYNSYNLCSYPTVEQFDRVLRDCIYVRDSIRLEVLPNLYSNVINTGYHA